MIRTQNPFASPIDAKPEAAAGKGPPRPRAPATDADAAAGVDVKNSARARSAEIDQLRRELRRDVDSHAASAETTAASDAAGARRAKMTQEQALASSEQISRALTEDAGNGPSNAVALIARGVPSAQSVLRLLRAG
jgi:hypothetical protein